jgi:hypothetical protein
MLNAVNLCDKDQVNFERAPSGEQIRNWKSVEAVGRAFH